MQDADILPEVDAHQHGGVRAEPAGPELEEGQGRLRLEVADGGAGEEGQPSSAAAELGQGEGHGVVGADGGDLQARKVRRQPRRGGAQVLARDVDGDVGGRILERLQEDAHLDR